MMDSPLILPICTVQPDFQVSINDVDEGNVPEETFWLSCYQQGAESVHGEVNLALNERDRNVIDYVGRKGVTFGSNGQRSYFATCEKLGIPSTRIIVPSEQYTDPLPQISKGIYQKISAFDVAPDGSQYAAGYNDGSVYIVPTSSSSSYSVAKRCHLSTVTSLRFFPSSRVLLTAGADFSVSILSADLPSDSSSSEPRRISAVRTLRGHTRAVTSTAIIARGRTVLSASKDATLRLWDVSSGAQIRMMASKDYSAINATSLGERSQSAFASPPNGEDVAASETMDPREVETSDKVVYCALANGTFEAFDLGSKSSVFRSTAEASESSVESISYSPSLNLLATGSHRGVVSVYDTRSLSVPLARWKRNGASVEDLAFISSPGIDTSADVGLAIATEDGLPYIANVRPDGPSVRAELVGTDCDGVRCIRVKEDTGEVWTASDDGVVRRYMDLRK